MNIKELEDKIVYLSQKYYEGVPECSDKQFDDLVEYLKGVNPNSEVLTKVGWGYDPFKNIGEKSSHLYGKVTGIDRKPRNIEDIPSDFLNNEILLSAKLDGLSIICYFVNGKFVRALTRGNGDTGIDKTDKVNIILKKELNIPNGFDFTGAIRGEICISNENWVKMQDMNVAGSNQRNTATGLINRDDMSEDINYLNIIFYKVIGFSQDLSHTFNEIYQDNIINANKYDVKFLRKFIKEEYIVDYIEDNGSLINQNDLENIFKKFNNKYPCDGIVITKSKRKSIDNIVDKYQNKVSIVNDEIAYKFVTETAITTIKDIRWKMSKGNKAIPVINVEPVELSGATVSNATAFNAKYVYDNYLDVGATVELVRSGEVIPYITQVIEGIPTAKEKLDNMTCPYCESNLEWDGVDLICKNHECSNRDEKNLIVWINSLAQTDGMSEVLIFKFLDELNINTLNKLYMKDSVTNNKYEDFAYINVPENSHKGKFNKVLYKLLSDEPIDFEKVLVALNIKQLGQKNAEKLAKHKYFPALFEEFLEIEDIDLFVSKCHEFCEDAAGPALINNICSYDGLNKVLNARYIENRIIYKQYEEPKELIPVVITGKLSVPRKQFEQYLSENGYEAKGAINKSIKYLITDNPNSGSSKNKKADELGIEKITESNFRNMISNSINYSNKYIL